MDYYTLYLDESETHRYNKVTSKNEAPHFCMAGVIIADKDITTVEQSIDSLKSVVWHDLGNPHEIILHQMLINNAQRGRLDSRKNPEYVRFSSNKVIKLFYQELQKVFANAPMTIIGSCISEDAMSNYYGVSGKNPQDKYLIAMQLILENYCHFLCSRNARGRILYEAINTVANESLRDKYYHMKLVGSMYMPQKTASNCLLGMDFASKSDNNPGLQVADFVPNGFARDCLGTPQAKYNIFRALKYLRYDGGLGLPDRFGVKYMP
jgi:hypothetical protein